MDASRLVRSRHSHTHTVLSSLLRATHTWASLYEPDNASCELRGCEGAPHADTLREGEGEGEGKGRRQAHCGALTRDATGTVDRERKREREGGVWHTRMHATIVP